MIPETHEATALADATRPAARQLSTSQASATAHWSLIPGAGHQSICIAHGDGIGPEIVDATVRVLESSGARLGFETVEMGRETYEGGVTSGIPQATWDALRRTGVLLKGPITTPQGSGMKSLNVTIRKVLGLFANIRPVRSYAPYVATDHPSMDLVVIRENEEDLYAGIEHRQTEDVVQCLKLMSRQGCERLIRYAFEYTRSRQRGKLTCMTKDNIMKLTDGLFHEVFDEVAPEYPDVRTEHLIVDIGIARVAAHPERFDVIVAPNLYGDILSDVAAEVSGSVGMAGAANIGAGCAVFEAVHGSAPDIAGLDVANPSGLLLASVKMLAHIGQGDAAERVHNAWLRTIEDGVHTVDMYRDDRSARLVGTTSFADAVIRRIGERPAKLRAAVYPRVPASMPVLEVPAPVRKAMVGVDVFVQSRCGAETLAARLSRADGDGLALTMITNRGVKVWPGGNVETLCTDHWRCRFSLTEGHESISHRALIDLLGRLEALGVDFVKTETLCEFDGKPAFSAGHGQ